MDELTVALDEKLNKLLAELETDLPHEMESIQTPGRQTRDATAGGTLERPSGPAEHNEPTTSTTQPSLTTEEEDILNMMD